MRRTILSLGTVAEATAEAEEAGPAKETADITGVATAAAAPTPTPAARIVVVKDGEAVGVIRARGASEHQRVVTMRTYLAMQVGRHGVRDQASAKRATSGDYLATIHVPDTCDHDHRPQHGLVPHCESVHAMYEKFK